jgi:hypothetical protein
MKRLCLDEASRPTFGRRPARLLVQFVLLVLLVVLTTGCRPGAPSSVASASSGAAEPAEALLTITWASTQYGVHEPDGAAVELRVLLDNRSDAGTEATSIRWDPAFATAFKVMASDPPAWRVRVDETGWGSLDTSGVLPGQYGEFRIWFTPASPAATTHAAGQADAGSDVLPASGADPIPDLAPHVEVVADGTRKLGIVVATPLHFAERASAERQYAFERGELAAVADTVAFVPSNGGNAYPIVVALTVFLAALTAAGMAAAFSVCTARAERPDVRPLAPQG